MGKVWCVAVAAGVLCAGSLLGCGKKEQELVAGADRMTDEQKLAKVEEYCDEWISALEASLRKRKIESFVGVFQRVEPDEKGCEIDLRRLTGIFRTRLQASSFIVLAPMGGGQIRARMRYLTDGGDPADADCVFTLSAGIAGAAGYMREYRPDPRVFAVLLEKK